MAMTRMTAQEMRDYNKKHAAELRAMYDKAPIIDDGFAGADAGTILRGFAAFKEHINKKGRPKVGDKQMLVSLRLPMSAIKSLRLAAGRGWRAETRDYIIKGLNKGDFGKRPTA